MTPVSRLGYPSVLFGDSVTIIMLGSDTGSRLDCDHLYGNESVPPSVWGWPILGLIFDTMG